jgi:FkbM family methyltransferase
MGSTKPMNQCLLHLAAWAARVLPAPLRRGLYRLGPLTDVLRRLLTRAAPAGLTEVEVAAGPLAGTRLLLDLKTEKDLWLGNYEPELGAALRSFARPGMTVFDVGANVGYVTLLLAKATFPGGRLFAFEPLPSNLDRLRANLALSGLENRVVVVPAAVTDRAGRAPFLVHASGGMGKIEGAAGRPEDYPSRLEVDTTDLDSFVYERGHPLPNLIKLDIEGGEVLALPGMRRLLQQARPVLLLELHGPEAMKIAREELGGARYTLHRMAKGFPQVHDLDGLSWKTHLVGLPDRVPPKDSAGR